MSHSLQPLWHAVCFTDYRLNLVDHNPIIDNPVTCTSDSCTRNLPSDVPNITCTLLRLCYLNVRGLISNSHYVQNLLSDFAVDVIAISEHWLHDYNLKIIHQLNNDFKFFAVPSQKRRTLYIVFLASSGVMVE